MHSEPSISLSSVQLGRGIKAVSTHSFQQLDVCVEEEVLCGVTLECLLSSTSATAGRGKYSVPVAPSRVKLGFHLPSETVSLLFSQILLDREETYAEWGAVTP